MNLDEIDKSLEKWRTDIAAASANLTALEGTVSYQALKTNFLKLTGKTKTAVGESISEMESMWSHLSLISGIIQEAESLRKDMPQIFGRGDRINKIETLLNGESITLQIKEVPLDQRGLTGAQQLVKKVSPKWLFTDMQRYFSAAATASALYEKSCLELTDKVGNALNDLSNNPNLELREKLDAICQIIDSDPLTGLDLFNKAKKAKKSPSSTKTTPSVDGLKEAAARVLAMPKLAPPPPPAPIKPAEPEPRMVHDPRLNRQVGTEGLNEIENLILKPVKPTLSAANQIPVVPSHLEGLMKKDPKPVSKIEEMLHSETEMKKPPTPLSKKQSSRAPATPLEDLINKPKK